MDRKNIKKIATGLIFTTMLSGCAINTVGQGKRVSNAAMQDAARLYYKSQQPYATENTDPIQIANDVWTGGSVRISNKGDSLPRQWDRPDGFVIRKVTPLTLFQIGSEITKVTNINVQFSPDVTENKQAGVTGSQKQADLNKMLDSMGVSNGDTIKSISDNQDMMRVAYQGNLSDFLNQVASHFSVSWSYNNGMIRFFKQMTRTYTINALPASLTMKSSISASADAQQASSGSGQSSRANSGGSSTQVDNTVEIGIWKDIQTALNGIVGDNGHVTASVSTGTLTVTAPPEIITRVDEYISGQNERLSKQVTVALKVLNVSLNNTDAMNFDLQSLEEKAGNAYLQYGNLGAATSSALTSGTPGVNFGVLDPKSPFNGLNGVFNLLSTAGTVTVGTGATATTPNGVPAQIQVSNIRGFVAQVQISNYSTQGSGSATSQVSVTPGSVTTGFSFAILPRINADGSGVLLQIAASLSELAGPDNGFINYSSGNTNIQLPDINSRNFVQQAFIPNGGTLVMTGFDQNNDSSQQNGTGNPGFFGLGGKQTGQHQRNIIVILLMPKVESINNPIDIN